MRVKFGDIAINSTAKKKPVEADKDTYLGLEHLDSGNLTVTRFGSEVAPIGEKLLMRKGDVLFGKRRAYQKKVAISPFDGIFSAHGMVLRPKTNVVTERFFPLFIASDYFLDAAIKISVGSLSPTINWSALKELEFTLPPLDEQDSLAEILWAMIDTKNAYKRLISLTDELVKAQFVEMFGDGGFPIKGLGEISEYFIGLTYKPSDICEDGTIVLRSGNIQRNIIDFNDIVRVNTPIKDRLYVQMNDILMCSRNGSADLVGKTALIPQLGERMTFGAFMTIVRSEYSRYLFAFFQSESFNEQTAMAKTSTINQITKVMLDNIKVPLPPLPLQRRFAAFAEAADKSKLALQHTLDELDASYKALLKEKLG